MRRTAAIAGVGLVVLLLLVGVVALAQDHAETSPAASAGTTLYTMGLAAGTLFAGLVTGAGGLHAIRGRPPTPDPGPSTLPAEVLQLMGRLDARGEATQTSVEHLSARQEVFARRQHRHGNALLVLMLREGHTPEETAALSALQDDSDEGDDPPKAA